MLDKDAKAAAERFMAKLAGNGFTLSRSKNNEDDYDKTKQERDSKAVAEFAKTDLFQDVMNLR